MKRAGEGRAAILTRRLDGPFDAVALADALDAPFLFARSGGKALVLVDAALRLEAVGEIARATPLTEAGALLAARLDTALASARVGEGVYRFPRCDDPDEAVRAAAPGPLAALRALLAAVRPEDDDPLALIAMGVIGFDHVDGLETLPRRPHGDFPDLLFLVPETLVALDAHGSARVIALAIGSDDAAVAERQHHLAAERLARTVGRIERPQRVVPDGVPAPSTARPDLDDDAFAAIVERLKDHIAAGDIFQAVPSRTFRAECADPRAAFRLLVAADPSAYQFRFDSGHGALIGCSPETAVEVERRAGRHIVTVRPIAGTRPRGASDDADARLEADLRLDPKEVAEHMMLVDLARNDVARVARPGTRRVARLLDTLRFRRVMHLESTVEGELAEGKDAIDAIRACMNVGTLSGAPKLKAIELIRAVEPTARGPYGGAIGYLSADGTMDSAVVIRSALVRGGVAAVRAGAGVVADSVPLAEAAETRAKASALLAAMGAAA